MGLLNIKNRLLPKNSENSYPNETAWNIKLVVWGVGVMVISTILVPLIYSLYY